MAYMTFNEKVKTLAWTMDEQAQGRAELDVETETDSVIVRRIIRVEFRAALKENHMKPLKAASVMGVKYQNLAKWLSGEGTLPSRRIEEVLFLG